ncbi:dihydrolipoyl dehydrogenase [Tepidibacillus sp. HK-1]|uniref:dihydrolipoyl dehydrogenase n=1 Tax=Tepidibacillus sp. HK-1 TaxID=1883407 RepID=UPI0008529299|nr:dihydrolipoyl dehydrogenase [Tepidibacillus sp. HK-1]GBF10472.1 dihydrolipoyl dehydrogenase [Tepidibacillus sp. HK-1]
MKMKEANVYDLVFLGGGPGGYVGAIHAAQLGLKVAVIEKDKVGGVCLHRGCIPTKALLRSAEIFRNTMESIQYGILTEGTHYDFAKVQSRKQNVVDQLHKGIEFLFKKNNVKLIHGYGQILRNPGDLDLQYLEVRKENGEKEIATTKKIIIGTGSRPKTLPGLAIDGEYIMTSDEALEMSSLPNSAIIIGGGVIGMEWASMLHDFGVEVTVIEFLPRILPLEDEEISKEMTRVMKKRKIKIHTQTAVLPESIRITDRQVELDAKNGDQILHFKAEKILVSVGRQANIEGIGLEDVNVKVEKGVIQVNEYFQTTNPDIYAIGDVIGRLQLAHVASHEAMIAVNHIAGKNPEPMDYLAIPRATFTNPEVASLGLTELEAKEQGYNVKVGKFQLRGNGKALIYGEVDGFIKFVTDKTTGKILGVHMMGPHVTDMITETAVARVIGATASQVAHTVHPHPTLSEAIMEAGLDVHDEAIHA